MNPVEATTLLRGGSDLNKMLAKNIRGRNFVELRARILSDAGFEDDCDVEIFYLSPLQ
jgi:hypothetical protein